MNEQQIIWTATKTKQWKKIHRKHLLRDKPEGTKFVRVIKDDKEEKSVFLKCKCGSLFQKTLILKNGYQDWKLSVIEKRR